MSHLGDHHHNLLPKSPLCHSVSLYMLASQDHPKLKIIRYLITCPITCYTSLPLSTIFQSPLLLLRSLYPARPPTPAADCRAIMPLLFSPIPLSLFRFQTPFGWSIGLSLANDPEVVWTVVDGLLEDQLPHIPLMCSSLHWLMEKGSEVNLLLWKKLDLKTNKYCCFFCLIPDPYVLIKPSIVKGK